MWKENNEVKLVTQEYKHILPQKRELYGTNHNLSVPVMTKGLRYAQHLSLPRQGLWNLVWIKQVFELSQVELIEFYCS